MAQTTPTQKYSEQWNDDAHFTLANVPYGIASTPSNTQPKIATRLKSTIYFLSDLISNDLLPDLPATVAPAIHGHTTLNALAALPRATTSSLRSILTHLFTSHIDGSLASHQSSQIEQLGHPVAGATLHLPFATTDFTDFSCSRQHVLNAGEAVFDGRTSSIAISGTPVRRPWGMVRSREKEGAVEYQPSRAVDFELEVAAIVGQGTKLGDGVEVAKADDSIFGFVLLNDWSARDIQGLEMNPLGPLNGKSFGTIISPWVIPIEALSPFKCAAVTPPAPTRAAYLVDPHPKPHYAVQLEVHLLPGAKTPTDAPFRTAGHTVSRSRLEWLEYTFRDMVAHQTVNGCPLRTGDLLATGTVSGTESGELGCLLEITKGGKQLLQLPDGQSRAYLQDGDGVRLTGWAGELGGERCVGFGEAYGILLPAHQ